jgi:hypothetical protein
MERKVLKVLLRSVFTLVISGMMLFVSCNENNGEGDELITDPITFAPNVVKDNTIIAQSILDSVTITTLDYLDFDTVIAVIHTPPDKDIEVSGKFNKNGSFVIKLPDTICDACLFPVENYLFTNENHGNIVSKDITISDTKAKCTEITDFYAYKSGIVGKFDPGYEKQVDTLVYGIYRHYIYTDRDVFITGIYSVDSSQIQISLYLKKGWNMYYSYGYLYSGYYEWTSKALSSDIELIWNYTAYCSCINYSAEKDNEYGRYNPAALKNRMPLFVKCR